MQTVENVSIEDRQHIHKIIGYDCDENSYARVPVDSYGLSLLQEMGWYEGRGVGINPDNALHHVIEVQPRHHRQGLSADQKPIDKNGNLQDPEKLENLLIPKRHREKKLNSKVKITRGVHEGLKGIIMGLKGKTQVLVELKNSEESVKLTLSDVELENSDEEKAISKISENSKKLKKEKKVKKEKSQKKRLKWVIPGIKVRIICRKFYEGKYYLTKGEVTEITGKKFTVISDKKQFIEGLKEKYVETLIPPIGQEVVFVKGEHKGNLGIVKEKDSKSEKVIVQILDDFSIVQTDFDSISKKGESFN